MPRHAQTTRVPLTQSLAVLGQAIVPFGHSQRSSIGTRPPSHFLQVPSDDGALPFGHLHCPLFTTLPPWHCWQVPFVSTVPVGHWQLGGVPTMPPVHFGLHTLAASSQYCPSGHLQLGGVPTVVGGQGS